MNFMELFIPMFVAFVAASVVMEILHTSLAYWVNRRQAAKAKEYYKEVAEKMGIDPDDFIAQVEGQMGGMGMMDSPPGMSGMHMGPVMPTTSGGGHGQYL